MDIAYALQDLMSTKPASRLKALRAIESTGARVATEHVIRVLAGDDVESIRAEAARVLGDLVDPSAVGPLVQAMVGDVEEVAFWASSALARLGADALPALGEIVRDQAAGLDDKAFFWTVQTLARMGGPSVPLLVELLASPTWTRRRVVAEALVKVGRPAESALLNRLAHPNQDVRFWICHVLGRAGSPETVERLRVHLDDENKDVRFAAVSALGDIGSQNAIRLLKDSLKSRRRDIRVRSLEILGRMGSDVVESLIDCLADDSWLVRDKAAQSIAKMGRDALRPLLHAYETGNEDIRINAVKAFCLIGEDAIDELLRALDDKFEPIGLKAAEGLAALGPKIVPRLVEYFHTASVNGKRFTLRVLGRSGDRHALDHALRSVESLDSLVRLEAVRALERFEDERVVEKLIEKLEDNNDDIRETAAALLAKLKNRTKTIASLVRCLSAESWILRSSAAQILGRIGQPAIKALYDVLARGDDDSRFWAIRSLGAIGTDAIEPLLGYLDDKSWTIRRNAAEALVEIGDPAAKPLLRKLETFESDAKDAIYWAEYVLSHLSGGTIRHLLGVLNKPRPVVRAVALRALARHAATADAETADATYRAVVDTLADESMEVRLEAVRTLGALGRPEITSALMEMYEGADSAFRREIIGSLGRIGGDEVEQFLIDRLEDSSWLVRREALNALACHPSRCPVAKILPLLADPADPIVEAAIPLLGEIGRLEAVEPLAALLDGGRFEAKVLDALARLDAAGHEALFMKFAIHPDQQIRSRAARGLGFVKSARAQNTLFTLLNDEIWAVRKAAAEALSGMQAEGEDRAAPALAASETRADLEMEVPTAEKYYRLGLKYKAGADPEKALASFKMALDLDPDYIPALCKLGLLYEERGEVELAIGCFKRAIGVNPDYAPARVYLGIAFGLLKNGAAAEAELKKAIAIDPESESARIAGNILKKMKRK